MTKFGIEGATHIDNIFINSIHLWFGAEFRLKCDKCGFRFNKRVMLPKIVKEHRFECPNCRNAIVVYFTE